MTALRCILIFFSFFFFLMIQKVERVCLADKPPLWESTWLIIWKTLCHFSWLNKIDWIFEFYDKVTLACLKWPSRESAALSLWQNLYFVPCRSTSKMSPQAEKHTLSPADDSTCQPCAPLYVNAKPLNRSAKSFLSISHHVIEQWGILCLHSSGDGVFKLN